jgi:hypothetical protein
MATSIAAWLRAAIAHRRAMPARFSRTGNRLGAEILGAGANRCTELLDLSRGLLRAGEVKVIAAFDIWLAARPWTCHLSRAILTIR